MGFLGTGVNGSNAGCWLELSLGFGWGVLVAAVGLTLGLAVFFGLWGLGVTGSIPPDVFAWFGVSGTWGLSIGLAEIAGAKSAGGVNIGCEATDILPESASSSGSCPIVVVLGVALLGAVDGLVRVTAASRPDFALAFEVSLVGDTLVLLSILLTSDGSSGLGTALVVAPLLRFPVVVGRFFPDRPTISSGNGAIPMLLGF